MKRITTLFTLSLMLASMMGMAQTAYITNQGDGTVSVINVATNIVVDTIKVGNVPKGVSVSRDGTKVYVTNGLDSTVSVINTAANTVSATITVGAFPIGVSVSPDGSKVYVANETDNTVSVINTSTNSVSATISVGAYPYGISVSPDGSKVYVTNQLDNTVSVINTATNTVSATIPVSFEPRGISVSPDGTKVYVANAYDNSVSVINTATNTVSNTITVGITPFSISVSPDGSKVYVTNFVGYTVSVITTAADTVSATIKVGAYPNGLSVSPDGTKVYVANQKDTTVSVINTATNAVTDTIKVGSAPMALGNFISTHNSSPIANFQSSASTICANDCINFTNLSTKATSWLWSFAGAADSTSTAQNPQGICYANAGTYKVMLIAANSSGSDTLIISNYITVHPAPPIPSINRVGNTLYCTTNPSYTSYQWSSDSVPIAGATDTFLIVSKNGNYSVQVTNENGCKVEVSINIIIGIQNYVSDNIIALYPNPATNQLTIHSSSFHNEVVTVSVMNVIGQETSPPQSLTPALSKGEGVATIDVSKLPAGMYFLQIKTESGSVVQKFVKE